MALIKRNLRHVQGNQDFNSPGLLEVPEEVFEELLVNTLAHRDYFISASIHLLIFADRIKIISTNPTKLKQPALIDGFHCVLPINKTTTPDVGWAKAQRCLTNQQQSRAQKRCLPILQNQTPIPKKPNGL